LRVYYLDAIYVKLVSIASKFQKMIWFESKNCQVRKLPGAKIARCENCPVYIYVNCLL